MGKIFVIGSINLDLSIHVEKYPKISETVYGSNFIASPGGKGANQAVSASKLGVETYFIGCLGNEFSEELEQSLLEYNVKCDFVRKIDDVPSGIAVILVNPDGGNKIIVDSGANQFITKEQVDKALKLAKKGDILIAQLECNSDVVEYALVKAKSLGLTTILNPAPQKKINSDVFSKIDYFIPNEVEAEFYTGIKPLKESDIITCLYSLKDLGVKIPIITLGKRGSYGLDGVNTIKMSAFTRRFKAVDTTAAGDSYVSAIAVSILNGKNLHDSMRFASFASSVTVSRKGAQISTPYLEEVDDN